MVYFECKKGQSIKCKERRKKSCQSHKSPTYFVPLCSLQPSKKNLPRIEILKEQRRAPFSVVERFIILFFLFFSATVQISSNHSEKTVDSIFYIFLIYTLIPLFNPISFFSLHSLTLVIKKTCSLFQNKTKNQLNSAGGVKAIKKAESKLR